MNIEYELPCLDSRKSFYGKATVIQKDDGTRVLRSYHTEVCAVTSDGKVIKLWDGYSATTMRHVNSFLRFCGVNEGGKAYWDSLPIGKLAA